MLGTWQKHDRNIIRFVQMSYKEPATEPSQILKMKNVIAARGALNVYKIKRGSSKLNVTVLCIFNESGVITLPTVVYLYKRLSHVVGFRTK